MKKLFTPFEELKKSNKITIVVGWLILLFSFWIFSGLNGTTHMFPTLPQVLTGFKDLWYGGVIYHLGSSLWLFCKAVFWSILISLFVGYSSVVPILKPISQLITKLRYLPLAGISFYISILVNDAKWVQVWVLVSFMSTYLTTSILAMIKDIPVEEHDHVRTLGYNRWKILWEVIIKGRFDYIIELVRQNFAIVWMMLVSVESILMAGGGLGTLIKNGDKMGSNGKVIAAQIIIIIFGLLLDIVINWGRKAIFRYSKM